MGNNYVAPEVEIIEVEVENGFAASGVYTGVGNTPSNPNAPGYRGWDDFD